MILFTYLFLLINSTLLQSDVFTIYENKEKGVYIKHPIDYEVKETSAPEASITFISKEKEDDDFIEKFKLSIKEEPVTTLKKPIKEAKKQLSETKKNVKIRKIEDKETDHCVFKHGIITYKSDNKKLKTDYFVASTNNRTFVFHGIATKKSYKEYHAVFTKMLNSFKTIKRSTPEDSAKQAVKDTTTQSKQDSVKYAKDTTKSRQDSVKYTAQDTAKSIQDSTEGTQASANKETDKKEADEHEKMMDMQTTMDQSEKTEPAGSTAPYYVQVGAFGNKNNAEQRAESMRQQYPDETVIILEHPYPSEMSKWKVLMPKDSRQQADQKSKAIRQSTSIGAFTVNYKK